jgi:hypothetical protein
MPALFVTVTVKCRRETAEIIDGMRRTQNYLYTFSVSLRGGSCQARVLVVVEELLFFLADGA